MVAVEGLALLTLINCLGVRSGSNAQSGLMVLKILAIAALVVAGLLFAPAAAAQPVSQSVASTSTIAAIGAAMTPVMFAYGGWQTSSFVAGEMRDPQRDLARGLLLGVIGVVLLYTAVAFVCVHALGPTASAIQRRRHRRHAAALGEQGRELHRYRHRHLAHSASSAREC